MYITQVLMFLAYSQGIFCWNFARVPKSIRDSNLSPGLNPLDDDRSKSDNWGNENNEQTRLNDKDDKENLSNNTYKEENTHSHHFILKCIRSCSPTNEYRPVCGTDDITYHNLDHLQCVRECGDDVELRHASPCNDLAGISTPSPTTTSAIIESCLSLCPSTSEYNPVCGTDNVTYKNIGKLTCAQICGVGVEVQRRSPCSKKIVDQDVFITEGPIETTTINRLYFHSCMNSCPTTTEYKPVCASNGQTFYNNGKFQCAKYCGLDISIKGLGVCKINQSEESETLSSSSTSTTITPYEVTNEQPVTDLQNLIDTIISTEDTMDPVLDVEGFKTPCKDTTPGCLKRSLQALIPIFINGVPELGIDSLDPFRVDDLNLELPGGMKIEFRQGYTKGLRKCIVDVVRPIGDRYEIIFHCNLLIKGKYRSSGKLLMFPIDGEGNSTIICKNLKTRFIFGLDTTKKGNDEYVQMKNVNVNHTYEGRVIYNMTDLFKGNPEMSKMVLDFMNQNWSLIAKEFGTPIVNFGTTAILNNVKKILNEIPLNKLLFKD